MYIGILFSEHDDIDTADDNNDYIDDYSFSLKNKLYYNALACIYYYCSLYLELIFDDFLDYTLLGGCTLYWCMHPLPRGD